MKEKRTSDFIIYLLFTIGLLCIMVFAQDYYLTKAEKKIEELEERLEWFCEDGYCNCETNGNETHCHYFYYNGVDKKGNSFW